LKIEQDKISNITASQQEMAQAKNTRIAARKLQIAYFTLKGTLDSNCTHKNFT
jgi:hypothetical protein